MKNRTPSREGLVEATVARMREMILSHEPDSRLGSLQDMTQALGVGVVTLQQASRILEQEGLLEVRRGPGGGFIGKRPDDTALGRSIARFLAAHGSNYHEAINIITLFDCELLPEAALSSDETSRDDMRALGNTLNEFDTPERRVLFETRFHDLLFRMVNQPLMELLARVTMRHYADNLDFAFYVGAEGGKAWHSQRRRIIDAILERDAELARFEGRRRRDYLMRQLALAKSADEGSR